MNYHNITHDDMNNGSGLRVVLWLSGCSHHCNKCQNQQTWNPQNGIEFDTVAKKELFDELSKDYISGITLSGGDPLYEENLSEVLNLVNEIRISYKEKNIWLYTGYTWDECIWSKMPPPPKSTAKDFIEWNQRKEIISKVDVLVDGRYIDEQRDITLKWRGSKNQRVIDVKISFAKGQVVLYCE